jgi:long-subunit acyl-CoA synthetase (AMP-forming)
VLRPRPGDGLRVHQHRHGRGWQLGERRNIAYSGYTDLAGKPEVCELIRECVEQVNATLAEEAMVADSQIQRFLVLHKELDPDDDELTRTRKVRRNFRRQEIRRC